MSSTMSSDQPLEMVQPQLELNILGHQQVALQWDPASLNLPVVQNNGYTGQLITGFENIHLHGNINHQPVRRNVEEKPKRKRLAYSDYQRQVLSDAFAKNPYINQEHRKQLSLMLGIPERNIKVWYQNRRQDRKKLMELDPSKKDLIVSTSFADASQNYSCPPKGNYYNYAASASWPHNAQYSGQCQAETAFPCAVNETNVSVASADTLATARIPTHGAFNEFDLQSDQHCISSTSDAAIKQNEFNLTEDVIMADANENENNFCLGDYINIGDATM